MSLTLVNLFTVPAEEAESFVARFTAIAENSPICRASAERSFCATPVSATRPNGFVNIATWEARRPGAPR